MPDSSPNASASSSDETLVDQAGRPLGSRALQTRQRILDATIAELEIKSMRDLRVIDIARRVGSSPATFYQYFKDVEDVILHLSEQIAQRIPERLDLIHGDWTGREGFERARAQVRFAFELWDQNGAVLRVRNNASDEGDERFRDARVQSIMPLIKALSEEIAASQRRAKESGAVDDEGDEWQGGHIEPFAGAMAIFGMVDRMAMYHLGIEGLGLSREQVVDTVATMMQFMMTSRR